MTGTLDKSEIDDSFPWTIRGGDRLSAMPHLGTVRSVAFTAAVETPISRGLRQKPRTTPKRRLRGFVIAFRGQEVRVGFVQADESIIEYLLPIGSLQKAGITEENQPFEMDEIEETSDGEYSLTYRYRPMAPASSAVTDILKSDERLAELRDAALQHFGNGTDH
jgi:hypothetical protein